MDNEIPTDSIPIKTGFELVYALEHLLGYDDVQEVRIATPSVLLSIKSVRRWADGRVEITTK